MKKLKSLVFVTLTVLLIFSGLAHAEGTRGGGDAVKNPNGTWSLLDLAESAPYKFLKVMIPVSLLSADIELHKALPPPSIELNTTYQYAALVRTIGQRCHASFFVGGGGGASVYLDTILDSVQEGETAVLPDVTTKNEPARDYVGDVLAQYPQMIWVSTDSPLENIPDEGTIRLLDAKAKQQVAVQKDGVVMVYRPIFSKMDAKSRAALIVHENLVYFVLKVNPHHHEQYGTSKIRELVKLASEAQVPDSLIPRTAFARLCDSDGVIFSGSSN